MPRQRTQDQRRLTAYQPGRHFEGRRFRPRRGSRQARNEQASASHPLSGWPGNASQRQACRQRPGCANALGDSKDSLGNRGGQVGRRGADNRGCRRQGYSRSPEILGLSARPSAADAGGERSLVGAQSHRRLHSGKTGSQGFDSRRTSGPRCLAATGDLRPDRPASHARRDCRLSGRYVSQGR